MLLKFSKNIFCVLDAILLLQQCPLVCAGLKTFKDVSNTLQNVTFMGATAFKIAGGKWCGHQKVCYSNSKFGIFIDTNIVAAMLVGN